MEIFRKKILNFDDKFFALDLGDASVKVFQMETNGGKQKIRGYASLDIPENCVIDGRVMDPDKLVNAIKGVVKNAQPGKINTKKVICSIAESKAFLRIINVPKMNPEEMGEAIRWEMEASIPLTADQVYYDWQLLNDTDGRQNVLTVAVSREVIDELMDVLKKAGLDAYGLEVESIACVRSLIVRTEKEGTTSLIVDLGSKRTSFIIAEGCIPYFTSSIPFSSEAIVDVISKSLSVSKQEAEEIKVRQGIEFMASGDIFPAVKPLLENLSSEIERSIDFYQSLSKERNDVDRVILSGTGANLRGLVPYLTARLTREVFVGDPWVNVNIGNDLPPISKEESIGYATAIGLALKKV